ncbi:MAG: hypothetical protein JO197_03055 [Acidobacteria bacterium]|nr:hypothetical protein [Acidobacteriota bacterium]MBV9476639.1 hypothetical protein [Acidobacteriota bacterium]
MSTATLPSFATAASAQSLSVLYPSQADETITISTSTDASTWPPPTRFPAWLVSSVAPSATVWNNTLYVLGASDGSEKTLQIANNQSNSVVSLPPAITTDISPTLVANGNALWAVFRSSSGDNTLFVTQSSDGTNWDLHQLPPAITTSSSPSAAVLNGTVYVAFRSSGDKTLFVTKSQATTGWDLTQLPPAITTNSSPAMAAMNGALFMVFLSSSSDHTMFISKSTDGTTWDLHQLPPTMTSQAAPTIATFNNRLYVLFQDLNNNNVWMTSSTDGVQWPSLTVLPNSIAVGSEPWTPPLPPP